MPISKPRPTSAAQKWAQQRNWELARLASADDAVRSALHAFKHDDYLWDALSQATTAINHAIEHIRNNHKSYKESLSCSKSKK